MLTFFLDDPIMNLNNLIIKLSNLFDIAADPGVIPSKERSFLED